MLWPIILPIQLTSLIMVFAIVTVTVIAAAKNWKPGVAFVLTSAVAIMAFVPSCNGIMSLLDARRFGVFQYASYDDVQDFRIERYLPPAAKAITLEKTAMGHRAKYSITETELREYIDQLWNKFGQLSAAPRGDSSEREMASADEFDLWFRGLGWPVPKNAICFSSPTEADGGGATYYFDPDSGTAYHRAGYW